MLHDALRIAAHCSNASLSLHTLRVYLTGQSFNRCRSCRHMFGICSLYIE